MLLEFCPEKELCMTNTWIKWKVVFCLGENETEIDFVLIKNDHQQLL